MSDDCARKEARTTTRYRCGPLGETGCGHVFEYDDGPHGLSAPYNCPACGCTFCGPDCCGNVAEDMDLIAEILGAKNPAPQ